LGDPPGGSSWGIPLGDPLGDPLGRSQTLGNWGIGQTGSLGNPKRAIYPPRFGPLGLRIRPMGFLAMPDRFPVLKVNSDSQNDEFLRF